jgi:hypothetical protein
MAYAHIAPRSLAYAASPARPKIGLVRRMLDAIERASRRRTDEQIARYLRTSRDKFTDELEREIERRFLSTPTR